MALLLQPSTIWRKVNKDSWCFILSLPHNSGQFVKLLTSDQQQDRKTRKQTKVEAEMVYTSESAPMINDYIESIYFPWLAAVLFSQNISAHKFAES